LIHQRWSQLSPEVNPQIVAFLILQSHTVEISFTVEKQIHYFYFFNIDLFMKAASIQEIKKALSDTNSKILLEYCLRLAKYKKENKEMLSFLLFEADDVPNFISEIKKETTEQFGQINKSNVYFIKKSVRKILRDINKQIHFAMSRQAECELLIHFCNCFALHSIPVSKSRQLMNLYQNQLKKIEKALSELHPDLQYDLNKQLMKPLI